MIAIVKTIIGHDVDPQTLVEFLDNKHIKNEAARWLFRCQCVHDNFN